MLAVVRLFSEEVCCAGQTAEAMQLGRAAAKYVSNNFPEHMELKFEKVAQPFMLLHVNRWVAPAYFQGISAGFTLGRHFRREHVMSIHACRYAGRAFESEGEVQEGKGALMVKGLKSMWRQAPPIVRNTLQGVLARIIMQARTQCDQWHNCHCWTVRRASPSACASTCHVIVPLTWTEIAGESK